MDIIAASLRSIEADLADPAPLLIYADWLEEQGKEQLAHAWRWMGQRGYRPAKRTRPWARIPWAWWHTSSLEVESEPEDRLDLVRHPQARLPVLVFRAMGSAGPHVYSRTLAEAVERLARWPGGAARVGGAAAADGRPVRRKKRHHSLSALCASQYFCCRAR